MFPCIYGLIVQLVLEHFYDYLITWRVSLKQHLKLILGLFLEGSNHLETKKQF
jgi:hypothetical protein